MLYESLSDWRNKSNNINQEVVICRALEDTGFHKLAMTFFLSKFAHIFIEVQTEIIVISAIVLMFILTPAAI